jgi:hypothetical protein
LATQVKEVDKVFKIEWQAGACKNKTTVARLTAEQLRYCFFANKGKLFYEEKFFKGSKRLKGGR